MTKIRIRVTRTTEYEADLDNLYARYPELRTMHDETARRRIAEIWEIELGLPVSSRRFKLTYTSPYGPEVFTEQS